MGPSNESPSLHEAAESGVVILEVGLSHDLIPGEVL